MFYPSKRVTQLHGCIFTTTTVAGNKIQLLFSDETHTTF